MQQHKKQQASGFTLIELLIVIAIIGLLATLAIVSLTGAQRKARDTKRIADAKQYQGALELYYNDNNRYPKPTDWATFVGDGAEGIGKYMTQAPVAPYNRDHATDADLRDYYSYAYNTSTASGSTVASQYVFLVYKLEDSTHAALQGDDDANYGGTTPPTGWIATDITAAPAGTRINSTTIATPITICGDSTALPIYCVSE